MMGLVFRGMNGTLHTEGNVVCVFCYGTFYSVSSAQCTLHYKSPCHRYCKSFSWHGETVDRNVLVPSHKVLRAHFFHLPLMSVTRRVQNTGSNTNAQLTFFTGALQKQGLVCHYILTNPLSYQASQQRTSEPQIVATIR